jgi:hypothetical protein
MAQISTGSSTAGKANVNADFQLEVNLPTAAEQAGFAQQAFVVDTLAKIQRVTLGGSAYSAEARQLIDISFNSASTAWSGKFGTNATTMTAGVQNGFFRLNSSGITTTTTGVACYTNRAILIERGYEVRLRGVIRHTSAAVTGKQAEFGIGYYAFAAGQAAAMNEFIGFRWTTGGGFQAVVATSAGGAATEQTANINGGTPLSDNVARQYEIIINPERVEFWIDRVFQVAIDPPTSLFGVIKSIGYPIIWRVFNSGVPAAAPLFDFANISAFKIGADDGQTHPARMSGMDKISHYGQPDVLAAATATHNFPGSGTAPTPGATGSNTASVFNNTALMGGFFRANGIAITSIAHSVVWIAGYQNPAIPTAAGAANNGRNFFVTSITLSPTVVTAALVGGGFVASWMVGVGASALSTATADANGTTAVAQKAHRAFPLERVFSFAAAAPLGTIETGQGAGTVQFTTPLCVHPGEFLAIGWRTLQVTAAVTAGTIDGGIYVNGYWD